uniref:Ribosomal protein L16 n=1 Tax=Hildenbrandia rubra TaxID=31481 RepID=A0A0A7A6H0_9FLOR|nr:ribosomal protein L16 [Hildenbrandia rubra]AHB62126.1 ribosomal protein L16 [Hildenbrandia rubra]
MTFKPRKKTFSRSPKTFSKKHSNLRFGYYGIKSCEFTKIKSSRLVYLFRFLEKHIKLVITSKKIRVWNRVTINFTLTKLSSEARMGKGKGAIVDHFTYIKPGQILFELEKIKAQYWVRIFLKMQHRIGLKIKPVTKT